MSHSIGDRVRSVVADFQGYVLDIRGGPNGPVHVVVSPDEPIGRVMTFTADEIEASDMPPLAYEVGQSVTVHAGAGVVTAVPQWSGGDYTVRVKRKRKSFDFEHVYRLPAWRIAIGGGA